MDLIFNIYQNYVPFDKLISWSVGSDYLLYQILRLPASVSVICIQIYSMAKCFKVHPSYILIACSGKHPNNASSNRLNDELPHL